MNVMLDFDVNTDGTLDITNWWYSTMDPDVSLYDYTMNIFKKNF